VSAATSYQPGKLVNLRGRDWIVLPSDDPDLLMVKPLGGSDEETTGIYLPLDLPFDRPADARFEDPSPADLGDVSTARLLYDSARLAFRNGAGPFRSLAKLSFRPRSYQMVPLVMALRQTQDPVRLLIADDVGVGKTIEALLIAREFIERRRIKRFAVICLPHLCEQWQAEIRDKLDIEAVIIRSNTRASLDRQIHGDTSVYDFYPYQVISVDFIKSDTRANVFIKECPELVIIDEAHACAKPAGASLTQQQRYHLLSRIAAKADQHLVLLTATPHSGKPEEFHSLLGLLKPEFETLDLPTATQNKRRELAQYFVQRKRADVEKWMGENTPFPDRDPVEWAYDLSPGYDAYFHKILAFAKQLIATEPKGGRTRKVHYWTALGLLRGVMSSPRAGTEMLKARLEGIPANAPQDSEDAPGLALAPEPEDLAENPVADTEFGHEGDNSPTAVVERLDWSGYQRQQLRELAAGLEALANPNSDQKLAAAEAILDEWIEQGFHAVVFCRYIATADYLGDQLVPLLKRRFPKADIQVITSELPDDVRKAKIEEMGHDRARPRVLIATDCLSEGVNLQALFTAVLHYDLPWNPNRLEQREGRVDRFGQTAPTVKTCLLYGGDNPIDGIVLDVLLRKVRQIKKSTGINVPFPEDSQSIIDTITQALLINPDRKISRSGDRAQVQFNFEEFDEAAKSKAAITRKLDEAAEREKASRSIFAQNAIKADEIEQDLKEVDEAIGDPKAVETFVVTTLNEILGVQVSPLAKLPACYRLVLGNLPPTLAVLLPKAAKGGSTLSIGFTSPTPEGVYYLGRNHRFVEQLCQIVMANTLAREGRRAARAAVIRTSQVTTKTTLLLFRCRNVIAEKAGRHEIVAEEMVLWGWRGTPEQKEFIDHAAAKTLLLAARASSDLSTPARASFLDNELKLLERLKAEFDRVAEDQSLKLVAAHERFSALMDAKKFQVVYPVLPMDLLGVYILLPE
jgi:superfamily II DNA or RNA helicase